MRFFYVLFSGVFFFGLVLNLSFAADDAADVTLAAASGAAIAIKERRHALVIGNAEYKSSPLLNPVNDAHDVAESLRRMGFNVIHRENLNRRQMGEVIREFGKLIQNGGIGLVYYAGHGVQINGSNYLIPVDADIQVEDEVADESIDLNRIMGKLDSARNRLNIVILDACRDNPFARSFRSSSQGLATVDAPSGTLVAYSTAPGSVAADGSGRNGVYTKYLLKYMEISGIPIESVFKQVRKKVKEETGAKQIPWENSSLEGDFFFAGGSVVDIVPINPVIPNVVAPNTLPPINREPSTGLVSGLKSQLVINTQPDEAKIFIDGQFKGRSPLRLNELDEGEMRIKASKRYFHTEIENVWVRKDNTTTLTLLLDPATGIVDISSNPDGLKWFIDGTFVGETPDTLKWVPAGDHVILVKHSNGANWKRTIRVNEGELTEITAKFQQPVTIESDPPGADWYLNGEKKGTTPAQTELVLGDHKIEVKADQHLDWQRLVNIAEHGKAQLIKARLTPGKGLQDTLSDGALAPGMVVIGRGAFEMGSVHSGNEEEQSVHKVKIKYHFAIARNEVTFADYDRFVTATGQAKPSDNGWGRGDQPVINVSWHDAKAYVTWLSEQTEEAYRLPSETEWEYAARANTTTPFWWGDEASKNQANCKNCGSRWDNVRNAPVASFPANPFGLYDTAGNVAEWVEDCWNDYYKEGLFGGKPKNGKPWLKGDCTRRVVRGGGHDVAMKLRSATSKRQC